MLSMCSSSNAFSFDLEYIQIISKKICSYGKNYSTTSHKEYYFTQFGILLIFVLAQLTFGNTVPTP